MTLTPELLLHGYSVGIFPMAEHRDHSEIFWVDPKRRGILPLDQFHMSRSLRKRILQNRFQITINQCFCDVVSACADRAETWINNEIMGLYKALHDQNTAHSLEVWDGETLVGGVYGVTLGAAFFGESMFSKRTDASKVALAYLVDRLNLAGFTLFDTQFLTDHLASLGAVEITRAAYHLKLESALQLQGDFGAPTAPAPYDVVQRNAQIS
jgi:leucyl/phenylalanyl-tRNA--protein transferase